MHVGPLQPRAVNMGPTTYTNLFVKLMLPVVHIMTTHYVMCQVTLSFAVGLVGIISAHFWPPFQNGAMNMLTLAAKALGALPFACAILAVWLKENSLLPAALLYFILILVPLGAGVRVVHRPELWWASSDASYAQL